MTKAKTQRGFTFLELIIVVGIIGVLTVVLFGRLQLYQEIAERTAMEQTVGTLKSALNLRVASYVAKDKAGEITELLKQNPMSWLTEKPRNYFGEYFNPRPGEVPPGHWYFDPAQKQLVYVVNRGEHFVADAQGEKRVRYRLALVYNGLNGATVAASEKKEIGGVVLETVQAYAWGNG